MRDVRPALMLAALFLCGCGENEDVDLCPDNDEKDHPGVCGCALEDKDSDLDGVMDCIDLCPNDSSKSAPGTCGCGVPDEDANGDTIPDCFDLCPDDPFKTHPGYCGCGVPDEDADGDTTLDCLLDIVDYCPGSDEKRLPGYCGCGMSDIDTDGDTIPDCVDQCEKDPDKILPGVCGCGIPESGLLVDSDGDGVVDCFDTCPDNPHKSGKEWEGQCEDDADKDGFPDVSDPCPYNGNKKLNEQCSGLEGIARVDCCSEGAISNGSFKVESALDFMQLRDILSALEQSGRPGQACNTSTWTNHCNDEKTALLVCDNGVIVASGCKESCSSSDEPDVADTCAGGTDPEIHDFGQPFSLELTNDINLAEVMDISLKYGHCEVSGVPEINLFNASIDGKKHTISASYGDVRCTLQDALFSKIVHSTVNGLKLNFDLTGKAHGSLANKVYASKIEDIRYHGTLMPAWGYDPIGGVAGSVRSLRSNITGETTRSTLTDVVSEEATIIAWNSCSVGGVIGELSESDYTMNEKDAKNTIEQIKGDCSVGGLFGYIWNSSVSGAVNNVQSVEGYDTVGGFAGYIGQSKIEKIQNTTKSVTAKYGFVGGFAGSSDSNRGFYEIIDEVEAISCNDRCGGFLGHIYIRDSHLISHVKSIVNNISCDQSCGGFIGNIQNICGNSGIMEQVFNYVGSIISRDEIGGLVARAEDGCTPADYVVQDVVTATALYRPKSDAEASGYERVLDNAILGQESAPDTLAGDRVYWYKSDDKATSGGSFGNPFTNDMDEAELTSIADTLNKALSAEGSNSKWVVDTMKPVGTGDDVEKLKLPVLNVAMD